MWFKRISLLAGPALAAIIALGLNIPDAPHAATMLGLALWMSLWWISECLPIAATALIPLAMFPLCGIATGHDIAPRYANSIIFLFIGGFLIAQGMERSGLHKRIALELLARLHGSPLQLALGFSLVTALLSMWISNTATTMLMVTIALPMLKRLIEEHGERMIMPMATSFMLIIAYSANIGGMGTPVGTAPNLVFLENMRLHAPEHTPSFLQWMLVGLPTVAAGLLVLFLWQAPTLIRIPWRASDAASLDQARRALGAMSRAEKHVAWILALTAQLWMTRKGIGDVPGWSALLPYRGVDDGTVAMFMAMLLFLLKNEHGAPILAADAVRRLPWDIVLLLGGGFALAYGMQQSGLSAWLGAQMSAFGAMPVFLIMLCVALLITMLTEITSNTATTQVVLPILAAGALGNGLDPVLLLLPATLSASCAFMLPAATPPNAIVFGSGFIHVRDMAKAGLRMNLSMALAITLLVWLLRPMLP
ncbi:MAG: SLC13/DASS family transporter [Zetaproteobacteria bacterium]|nr:MAG: SLC13/DASS family transporter [Zetaproteobacteria bacterium]